VVLQTGIKNRHATCSDWELIPEGSPFKDDFRDNSLFLFLAILVTDRIHHKTCKALMGVMSGHV
jgi:hypothetical protein